MVTIAGASAYTIVVSCTVIFLFFSFANADRAGTDGLRQDLDEDGTMGSRRALVQARRSPLDPVGDPHLLHRRPAAERLGAVDHGRIPHLDRNYLACLRTAAVSRVRRSAT